MSKGWISLHRGDLVESLMEHNPNAFLLLTQIAMRARRDDCPITGLKTGEAFIGDFKKAGIPTQMKYRTAKKQLESIELVTFKTTNKGTIATLLDTRVYSTNKNDRNDQNNIKITSQQRADNDQITTKKNVRKKECKKEELYLVSTETPELQLTTITPGDIYQQYPKKVAKPSAIKAIKKSLKTIQAHELLRLTTEYAAARSGTDTQFTPNPATWFNGERYNDDPETWQDSGNARPSNRQNRGHGGDGGEAAKAGAGISVRML